MDGRKMDRSHLASFAIISKELEIYLTKRNVQKGRGGKEGRIVDSMNYSPPSRSNSFETGQSKLGITEGKRAIDNRVTRLRTSDTKRASSIDDLPHETRLNYPETSAWLRLLFLQSSLSLLPPPLSSLSIPRDIYRWPTFGRSISDRSKQSIVSKLPRATIKDPVYTGNFDRRSERCFALQTQLYKACKDRPLFLNWVKISKYRQSDINL